MGVVYHPLHGSKQSCASLHPPLRAAAWEWFVYAEMGLTKQERLNSNWEGMLKQWSLNSNADGTHRPAPNWSQEGQEWFMNQNNLETTVDPADRVYRIASYFGIPAEELVPLAQFEGMLDELKGYVKSIEVLYIDGFLSSLLRHELGNKHANIRAKAAEVVTTMVQNNPTSQQLVMELNGLQPLFINFVSDPDETSRTKALGAISSLIRNNEPGITTFRLLNGYAALRDALSSKSLWFGSSSVSVGFQREALNLIQYLLHENSSDCNIVIELELPSIMMHLASSDDAEVREAALRGLLVLARDEGDGNSGRLVKNNDKLKQVLQERIEGISAMAPIDLCAAREERQLVDSLWNACYNEHSIITRRVYLCYPVRMHLAPDVGSKLFEPPPRAWAAAELLIETLLVKRKKLHCL